MNGALARSVDADPNGTRRWHPDLSEVQALVGVEDDKTVSDWSRPALGAKVVSAFGKAAEKEGAAAIRNGEVLCTSQALQRRGLRLRQ